MDINMQIFGIVLSETVIMQYVGFASESKKISEHLQLSVASATVGLKKSGPVRDSKYRARCSLLAIAKLERQ